ncbi:hypothetical protein ACFW04_013713 [Cataglyphis niger]
MFKNICILMNIKILQIIDIIEYKNITNSIENIKFAIGMMVSYTRDDYFSRDEHDGVIIGWHRECRTILTSVMFAFLH